MKMEKVGHRSSFPLRYPPRRSYSDLYHRPSHPHPFPQVLYPAVCRLLTDPSTLPKSSPSHQQQKGIGWPNHPHHTMANESTAIAAAAHITTGQFHPQLCS